MVCRYTCYQEMLRFHVLVISCFTNFMQNTAKMWNLWISICLKDHLCKRHKRQGWSVNLYCQGLFQVEICSEVCIFSSSRCTLQCISQQPMMIEQFFNLIKTLPEAESVGNIRLCLHWKKLFMSFGN